MALMLLLLLAATLLITGPAGTGPAGAQGSAGDELTILLASPGEGETFYAASEGFRLSVPIAGQVVSYETPLDPQTVELTVDFIDRAGNSVEITTTLDDSGRFQVWASIMAPDRPFPSDDPHDIEDCSTCHRWDFDLPLPDAITQVVVHARAADGRTGRAARRLRLDRGFHLDLVARVEGLPPGAENAQVNARTLI